MVLRGRHAGQKRRVGVHSAVIPGQIGIGVYSPPIDALGNSVCGIRVCEEVSGEFELHAFNNRTNVRGPIRRQYRGDVVRSNRLRTPEERRVLAQEGRKVAVLEVQGALFFGSTEQFLRLLAQQASEARYVIVDFKRVHLADTAAHRLIARAARTMAGGPTELVFAAIADDGALASLALRLHGAGYRTFGAQFPRTRIRPSNGARIGCSPVRLRRDRARNSRSRNSTCSRDFRRRSTA